MSGSTFGESQIAERKLLVAGQVVALITVGLSAICVWVIGKAFPTFFVYPYFTWGGWEAVWKFWPLYATYAAVSAVLTIFDTDSWPISLEQKNELLIWRVITSVLAGIWEELGYRWAFICFAMIIITILNTLVGAGLGWGLVAICVIGFVFAFVNDEKTVTFLMLIPLGVSVAFALFADPVYWFYGIMAWVIHYTTFTMMDPILYGGYSPLFIFGAIVANSWFRDGHQYQGILGTVMSWYAGMVLIYATLTYGLYTAIVVHALCNILVRLVQFVLEETDWR